MHDEGAVIERNHIQLLSLLYKERPYLTHYLDRSQQTQPLLSLVIDRLDRSLLDDSIKFLKR
jgi:hypothetical protein